MISKQELLDIKAELLAEVIDDPEEITQELFELVPDLVDEIIELREKLGIEDDDEEEEQLRPMVNTGPTTHFYSTIILSPVLDNPV